MDHQIVDYSLYKSKIEILRGQIANGQLKIKLLSQKINETCESCLQDINSHFLNLRYNNQRIIVCLSCIEKINFNLHKAICDYIYYIDELIDKKNLYQMIPFNVHQLFRSELFELLFTEISVDQM